MRQPGFHPSTLTELDVSGSPIGLPGLPQLAHLARSVPTLRTLRAVGVAPKATAADCAAVAEARTWGHWGNVTALCLGGNRLPFPVLSALLEAAAMRRGLQLLSLPAVMAGEAKVLPQATFASDIQRALLERLSALLDLEVLDLSSNPLGPALNVLAEQYENRHAESQRLLHQRAYSGPPEQGRTRTLIAGHAAPPWPCPPSLRTVVLERCLLTPQSLLFLLRGVGYGHPLEHVNLRRNVLSRTEVQRCVSLARQTDSSAAVRCIQLDDGELHYLPSPEGRTPAAAPLRWEHYTPAPTALLDSPCSALSAKRRWRARRADPVEFLARPQGKTPRHGAPDKGGTNVPTFSAHISAAAGQLDPRNPQHRREHRNGPASALLQRRGQPDTLIQPCYLSMTA
jgi:hypothetical protein